MMFQASLLVIAVAVYWSGSLSRQTPLLFFLGLIVSTISYLILYLIDCNIQGKISGNTKVSNHLAIGDEDDFTAIAALAKPSLRHRLLF